MTERPKWPDTLPLPIAFEEVACGVQLAVEDFPNQLTVAELAHDIFWYGECNYFVFYAQDIGFPPLLNEEFERLGLEMKKVDLYFFKPQIPHSKNDFIQVLPHEATDEWRKNAATTRMYARADVTLTPSRRKEMEIAETAAATAKLLKKPEPLLQLKPGAYGISVDLKVIWRWLRTRWKGGKKKT